MRFIFILLLLSGSTALMGGLLMLHDMLKSSTNKQESHSKVVERKVTNVESLFDSKEEPYRLISAEKDSESEEKSL